MRPDPSRSTWVAPFVVALKQLVLLVVTAQTSHLRIHLVPFGLRVQHQTVFKNVSVHDKAVVDHPVQRFRSLAGNIKRPLASMRQGCSPSRLEHVRFRQIKSTTDSPLFPLVDTFSHFVDKVWGFVRQKASKNAAF